MAPVRRIVAIAITCAFAAACSDDPRRSPTETPAAYPVLRSSYSAAELAAQEANLTAGVDYVQGFEKSSWHGEVKGMTVIDDVLIINTPLPPGSDRSDALALQICNALSGFRMPRKASPAAVGIGGLQVRSARDTVLAQRRPNGEGC